jgi:hypothetical protein
MTDFDPGAYLTQTNDEPVTNQSNAEPAFDPGAYLTQPEHKDDNDSTVYDADLFRKRVGRDPSPTELANFKQFKGEGFSTGNGGGSFTGLGEATLATGAGVLRGMTHAANDILPDSDGSRAQLETQISQDPILNYRGGPEAQPYLEGLRTLTSPITWAADKLHQAVSGIAGPRVADIAGDAIKLLPVARGADIAGIGRRIVNSMDDPEAVAAEGSAAASGVNNSQQSMGAAKTAPITNASPEFQEGIRKAAQQTGGAINPTAAERIQDAESLPVKARLTPGQSSGDPSLISEEQNLRGTDGKRAQLYNDQNQNLIDNFDALRERVGPDVFSTNPVEHGDTLIDAYQAKDKVARAAIDQAYSTARDAIPSTTPVVSAQSLLDNVNARLEDKWATESAPPDIMRRLQNIVTSGKDITAGQFEGLRSRLAELARSNDGSTRFAANQIRSVVEDSDLLPWAREFKEPFDQARALARAHFQALEADPAYNDAVNGLTPPDRFTQKYVTGPTATRDGVATMRANLADNPVAAQTMGVAALDQLRRASLGTTGNVSQSALNKQLNAMSPKMPSLFDPQTTEHLETLGRVAGYQQIQPKGAFVNNSNTTVSALAQAAKTGGEVAVNAAGAKVGVPVLGTWVRGQLDKRAAAKATKEFLDPYGGLKVLRPSQTAPTPAGVPSGQSALSSVIPNP